jgi:prepilin-type N-terminal cleavage/methylation domain-containing protein
MLISSQRGFTLIEIIVTIVIAAALSAMFLQVMSTNLTGSVEPLMGVQDSLSLGQVVERITVDYNKLTAEDSTPLATLKSRIGDQGDEVINGVYGSYTVGYNDYIVFNDENGDGIYEEGPDGGAGGYELLKVTVTIGTQRLTSLFKL